MTAVKKSTPKVIRSKLVRRGTSLRAWARANGHSPFTVYAAVNGLRAGKKSKQILEQLNRDLK